MALQSRGGRSWQTEALTAGEIGAGASRAFGDRIAYQGVRIVDGPGTSFAAHIAFMRGNPAITLGIDRSISSRDYSADFAGPGTNARSFIHEMTHVWQYAALGQCPLLRALRQGARRGRRAMPDKHVQI